MPPSLLAVWAWPEGLHEGAGAVLGGSAREAGAREAGPRESKRRRGMSVTATRDSRIEKRYRRLLALYPKDHRREHAEEMVGVLLAADGDTQVRTSKPVAWALRFGQHTADSADLIGGALRIRGRMALNRLQRTRWLSWTVRDQRWSDALAVVSVVAPLLLLVAALTEFRIPQAVASSITGHPHWGLTATLGLADLPMAAGAPGVTLLVFLRLRRLAGLGALATAIGQIAAGAVPAFARPGPRPGPADPQRHRPGRRRGADPRRVQRGRRRVVRPSKRRGAKPVRRLRRQGGRPARRPADRRGPGQRGGRVPACPGQPAGPRAAGHPGHPLRVPVAGEAGRRPVRAARRRLGHHLVLNPPALPSAVAAGVPDPVRDLARPPAGR